MNLSHQERRCLQLIAESPRELGWRQLDRGLVVRGQLPRDLLSSLKLLIVKELVVADGDPNSATTRYEATTAGREPLGGHSCSAS